MTLDRAILCAVWTAYIYVGSTLKDRRLLHYIGEPYRQYQERVAGYPFIPVGPLGRIPRRDANSHERPKSAAIESSRRIAA